MTIAPYTLSIPQHELDRVLRRLADAHWPDIPATPPGTSGVDPALVRAFVEYVTSGSYDWREQEAALNALPHFSARIEDYAIHFLHFPSAHPNARPLLLSHGWPGSFLEFLDIVERLTQPEKFGGRAEDAWSVVIASLPGYGLSSKPAAPIGPRTVARLFDQLMRMLGYDSYVAQGGDWGSVITSWLGYEGQGCAAIHLNFTIGWAMSQLKPSSDAEIAAAGKIVDWMKTEGAYVSMQATKPLTLSFAMSDSPIGAAAWLIEKFNNWSDLRGDNLWAHFNRDRLTTHIMIYLLTNAFGTASWMYRGMFNPDEIPPQGARVTKPTGVANYPGEICGWPRSMVAQAYNVVHWLDAPKGGHFAAFEAPDIFAADLTAFRKVLG